MIFEELCASIPHEPQSTTTCLCFGIFGIEAIVRTKDEDEATKTPTIAPNSRGDMDVKPRRPQIGRFRMQIWRNFFSDCILHLNIRGSLQSVGKSVERIAHLRIGWHETCEIPLVPILLNGSIFLFAK